jgi:dCMP deaminase
MAMLPLIAERSHDPNTKTSCVIVGPDHEIRSTGYNGFPRGIRDDVPERLERPEKYFWIEHAERNAIYNAARVGVPLKDCTLYLSWLPCMDCARAMIQAGISRLVVDREEHERRRSPKWEPDFARVGTLLSEAGVILSWWSALEV